MDIYEQDFEVNEKSPNHPITKADIDSHLIIKESLENLLPGTHFFSEESQEISWEKRKSWINYWLVDPLDGTKEFIKKNREFTINIALINNFKPILGVVYAPCFSKIYFAAQGLGSFFQEIDIKENTANVTREIDEGLEMLKLNLPAIITCHLRLNEPRYASLPNIMKAKKKPIEELSKDELGVDTTPRIKLIKVEEPPKREKGAMVKDVAELIQKLKHEAKVI